MTPPREELLPPNSWDLVNPRRTPRVQIRLPVLARQGLTSWTASTDDLGAGGCQLLSPRPLQPGRPLKITISCPPIGRAISASGKVAWASDRAPWRAGISFDPDPARGTRWFEALLRADERAAAVARRTPTRLLMSTWLRLGEAPEVIDDFSPEELAVLRAVGTGTTIEALAAALGEGFEPARGPLFSLVARRLLVLTRGQPRNPGRWRALLAPAERPRTRGARGARRAPPAALKLREEGTHHLAAGRLALALTRFRDALALDPDDEALAGTVERLESWARR